VVTTCSSGDKCPPGAIDMYIGPLTAPHSSAHKEIAPIQSIQGIILNEDVQDYTCAKLRFSSKFQLTTT